MKISKTLQDMSLVYEKGHGLLETGY